MNNAKQASRFMYWAADERMTSTPKTSVLFPLILLAPKAENAFECVFEECVTGCIAQWIQKTADSGHVHACLKMKR